MATTTEAVLNHQQIQQKIRRLAYEIYEDHFEEQTLWLVGIAGQGYVLATQLQQALKRICPLKIELVELQINKETPSTTTIVASQPLNGAANQAVILVDDVLYTGRTLAYSLKPLLDMRIKSLRVAVLVNRSHTVFPIQPRYTGYELATTLSDHIEVLLQNNNFSVVIR